MFLHSYTIESEGVWEKKVIYIPPNTSNVIYNANTNSISLHWWLGSSSFYQDDNRTEDRWVAYDGGDLTRSTQVNIGAQTNNYFQITGVQLELGKVATPFEHRSYGEELALCQRYFQQIGSQSNAFPVAYGYLYSGGVRTAATISLATSMRATPSLSGASSSLYIVGNGLRTSVSPSFFSTTNVPNVCMVSLTSGSNTHSDLGNDDEIVMVLQSHLDEVLDLDAEL
jgi:hypothetical protein